MMCGWKGGREDRRKEGRTVDGREGKRNEERWIMGR